MSRTRSCKYWLAMACFCLTANSAFADQRNLFTWFKGGESTVIDKRSNQSGHLPMPLAEFVFSKFGAVDSPLHLPKEDIFNCYGELSPDQYIYSLELTNEGIRFILPLTRNGSCGEEIRATFEELEPFMNMQGLKHVAQFKKSRKGKRHEP